MSLSQHDDVIEQFATDAADPALSDAVLPGTAVGGPRRLDAEGLHRRDDGRREGRVPIEDQVARGGVERERLAELLDHPRRRGVVGDGEPKEASSTMLDREPDVEDMERHRRNDEEVHRGDRIAVVAEKDEPALDRFGTERTPRHVARDGALRDVEAKHDELTMNARRAPGRVSAAIRRINARTSASIEGRPRRRWRDSHVQ